jgi:Cu+-exporting ATPase
MNALFQQNTAIDPVCKMTVEKANPSGGTAEHEGETYYFCGPGCREAFVAEPGKFLGHDDADHSHMHDH